MWSCSAVGEKLIYWSAAEFISVSVCLCISGRMVLLEISPAFMSITLWAVCVCVCVSEKKTELKVNLTLLLLTLTVWKPSLLICMFSNDYLLHVKLGACMSFPSFLLYCILSDCKMWPEWAGMNWNRLWDIQCPPKVWISNKSFWIISAWIHIILVNYHGHQQ